MSIATLTRTGFVNRFGGVYEHSPWAAEGAFDAGAHRGARVATDLAPHFAAVVDSAGTERQMALLRAHPDLAGRLAQRGDLTADSRAEQAGAGLDRLSAGEFAAFTALNAAYTEKFGFPFIIAVKGKTAEDILTTFGARIENDAAAEFRTALDQVHEIARLRLAAMA